MNRRGRVGKRSAARAELSNSSRRTGAFRVAIDLGAGSGRAMLGRLGDDGLLLREVHRFRYEPRERDGHLRWDFAALLDGVREGLKAAAAAARELCGRVHSVGVDSWAVDYALLRADGALVEDPVCYRDGRTPVRLVVARMDDPLTPTQATVCLRCADVLWHRLRKVVGPLVRSTQEVKA